MEKFQRHKPEYLPRFEKEYEKILKNICKRYGLLKEIDNHIYNEKHDHFKSEGCCLVCSVKEENCWCQSCKCKNCEWYDKKEYIDGVKCFLSFKINNGG